MPQNDVEISQPIKDFLEVLRKETTKIEEISKEKRKEEVETEEASSPRFPGGEAGESMALFYEKIRRLIEYKDDHLIKRSAIERILKRSLIIEWRQSDFTGQFIEELVMAGYLTREKVSEEVKSEVGWIIGKYQTLFKNLYNLELRRWLVGMASCEIEEILFPQPVKKALVRALFQSLEKRIVVQDESEPADSPRLHSGEAGREIQIYLASLRSLSKVDNVMLGFILLKIYLPQWFQRDAEKRTYSAKELFSLKKKIERKIASPLISRIAIAAKKTALYFNIFSETMLKNTSKAEVITKDPEALRFAVQMTCEQIYDQEMKKFKKRVRRSLAFLVITKVLLAIFLEYPYAKYVLGSVTWLPIYINLLFPPLFLIFLSATVAKPGSRNSALIAEGGEGVVYDNGKNKEKIIVKAREERSFQAIFLDLFFFLTFGLSFGLTVWILHFLKFDLLAILIFLFLASVVSFFSALVRQPIRDLVVMKEKEGLVTTLLDTLFLPFVRIGKWMTENFSKVNVFLFVFDVFIEAPFKVFVRFIQDWAGFIRKKKEEMI
jgi:hypothetical protein